jgi:membrane-associated PAP2 superfamily phosphatase
MTNSAPPEAPAAADRGADRPLALLTAGLALAFLGWEASGGDLLMAGWAGSAGGFALRDTWLLSNVMHDGARWLAWILALGLCLGVWWPVGPLRALPMSRRLQLAGGVLVSVLAVSVFKSFNPAFCPWDLAAFGGKAQPVSHWLLWARPAGGGGHCFPAGHASAGFGFIGGWFVFRAQAPALARRWLMVALFAGLLLGLTQQWRGAHFMSHTLWSGWLCWCMAWALDAAHRRYATSAAPALEAA